jgi:hypothetical protein
VNFDRATSENPYQVHCKSVVEWAKHESKKDGQKNIPHPCGKSRR